LSPICCPQCGSSRLYRNGWRYLRDGSAVQRWLCRECFYRFSETTQNKSKEHFQPESIFETKASYYPDTTSFNSQIRAFRANGAKNLDSAEKHVQSAGISLQTRADAKGKIVEFSFWLLKQGYAPSTTKGRVKRLNRLIRLGADLSNEDSVKQIIATQE
jgi:transposase-like protein